MAPTPSGVDGFPLTNPHQHTIDQLLRAASSHAPRPNWNTFPRDPEFLAALNERVRWLAQHDTSHPSRTPPWIHWSAWIGELYVHLLSRTPSLPLPEFLALLEIERLNWLVLSFSTPLFTLCTRYISEHGFDPALTAAMDAWQKNTSGTIAAQTLRKEINWLLWFDTTTPLKEKDCWSACIRRDLRAMPPGRRNAWIALLRNVTFAIVHEPPKKWKKPAAALLETVGVEDFQHHLRQWFAPFRNSETPLRLTVPGADVLRVLFWYSQLAADSRADEAIRWFATARWKTKADASRTAKVIAAWIDTLSLRSPDLAIDTIEAHQATGQLPLADKGLALYQDLCCRAHRTPSITPRERPAPDPGALDRKMREIVQRTLASIGNVPATLQQETLTVTHAPTGEQYQIDFSNGRILRLSDRRIVRLELDWSQPPWQHLRSFVDGPDQLDPFRPNYFRTLFCAQLLSGQLPLELPLVEDDSLDE